MSGSRSGPFDQTMHAPGQPAARTESSETAARLGGRYELLGLLGVGGMGSVYKATDLELGEVVAIKLLRRELTSSPGILERFKSEVRLARRVTHPNVARVFDIGEHEGDKFLSMEFVDGESLAARISREGRISLQRAVALGLDVCSGLAAAHAAGVIHRDLKPENILIATDGRVVLTDFGIARLSTVPANAVMTQGMMIGTPAYMAPEQVEGKEIDVRADVYALGATLFELFTGERAWIGETAIAVAAARLASAPPDPVARRADLPEGLSRVVLRCMARSPEDRYADVASVAADLAAVELGRSVAPPAAPSRPRAQPPGLTLPHPLDRTVAVLPFRNVGKPDDDYIAEGLTEEVIDTLSMAHGLKVRPRTLVLSRAGRAGGGDPRELGRALDVQVVVEGSVKRLGASFRITARALTVDDGFQLWAKRFDRAEGELLVVGDEVARAIADALTTRLAAPAREASSDPVAIDLYLRARAELRQFGAAHYSAAVDLLEQALTRAPEDPTMLSALAIARARLWYFRGIGKEVVAEAARAAIAAGPHLGEARLAMGLLRFYGGEYPDAVREARRAAALAPSVAEAHVLLGRILVEAGLLEDGIRRLEVAASIEPSLVVHDLWRALELAGRAVEAEQLLVAAVQRGDRGGAWLEQGRRAMWRGDRETAARLLENIALVNETHPLTRAMLQLVVDPTQWEKLEFLKIQDAIVTATPEASVRRRMFGSQMLAESAAYAGAPEAAVGSIGHAVRDGLVDIVWMDRCPLFEAVRMESGYAALREEVARRAARVVEAYLER